MTVPQGKFPTWHYLSPLSIGQRRIRIQSAVPVRRYSKTPRVVFASASAPRALYWPPDFRTGAALRPSAEYDGGAGREGVFRGGV
jgi:hypothetical protein